MGRSYWFECLKCGYRAKVAGRADRGHDFFILTILCRDCHQLYDAVTRLRVPAPSITPQLRAPHSALRTSNFRLRTSTFGFRPPTFDAALNRLPRSEVRRHIWRHFKPQCPINPTHRVEPWSELHPCPKCGLHLEKNPLPYRIWD